MYNKGVIVPVNNVVIVGGLFLCFLVLCFYWVVNAFPYFFAGFTGSWGKGAGVAV